MSRMTDTAISGPGPATRSLRTFLAPLMLVELFSGVIQFYFTPVYGEVAKQFDVSVGALSWTLTGFTLAGAVATPVFSKLGDVYGHRKILRIHVAVIAAGSVLVAVSPTFTILIIGRILQGMFPAYLPLMFGLVHSRYDKDDTRRAISYLTSILIFGVIVGLVGTGFITKFTQGPTWALWFPAIGTLVGLAGLLIVRGEHYERPAGMRVDWAGAATLGGGFALLLLGISEGSDWGWLSARVLGAIIIGVILLALFAVVELRIDQPLADLRWLFKPHFVPIYGVGFFAYAAAIGGQVAISTFMSAPTAKTGYGLGLNAFHLSLWLAAAYVIMFIGVFSTARLGRAIGFRPVMFLGALISTIGFLCLVIWHGNLTTFMIFFAIAVGGFGFIESSTRTLVVDGLREGEVSMGEGMYELSISVGPAVGSAVIGAVLAANESTLSGVATQTGYKISWIIMFAVCLAAAIIAAAFVVSGREGHGTELD